MAKDESKALSQRFADLEIRVTSLELVKADLREQVSKLERRIQFLEERDLPKLPQQGDG